MTELIIDNEIAKRLLDDVLRSMLDSYTPSPQPSNWPLEMARLAEADTSIQWSDDAIDYSERSREILENNLPEHLLKRLHGDEHDST
jgi:hypothetical protein